MNKIYKVVWNKARNCYVVGSEFISNHSAGKTSIIGSHSIKAVLAVAIVCSTSYFSLSNVFAADGGIALPGHYVAIAANQNDVKTKTYTVDGKNYTYTLQEVTYTDSNNKKQTEYYYVRDGYSVEMEQDKRHDQSRTSNVLRVYRNSATAGDTGLLQSSQVMIKDAMNQKQQTIQTKTGNTLRDVSAGTYVGTSNSGGTETPIDGGYEYFIQDNGKWVDAHGAKTKGAHFKSLEPTENGTYKYNGQVVSIDNLYTVTKKGQAAVGVFVTSSGNLYTGKVFGRNNEVLMTTKNKDTIYSYWAAETEDPDSKIENMTVGQLNNMFNETNTNVKKVAGDAIDHVNVTKSADGGTISLIRRGMYNPETGMYESPSVVDGSLQLSSSGGIDGNDITITVSQADDKGNYQEKFSLNAGSKVEAIGNINATTGIKINGQAYNFTIPFNIYSGGQINNNTYKSGEKLVISNLNFDFGNGLKAQKVGDGSDSRVLVTLDKDALKNDPEFKGPQGEKGDKGDTGTQGPQGEKGDKGDTGAQGPQGEKGDKGDTGTQGPQGEKGDKGDTGAQGPQGEKGDKGDTGAQGPQGEKGDKGDTGAQGPQGEKGDKGDTGAQGPQGEKGDKGDTGTPGKDGGVGTVIGDGSNIKVENQENDVTKPAKYKVSLNRKIDVDQVNVGKTTISKEGLSIDGGPSMTIKGIDAGGKKITNVAAGTETMDAVNYGQLKDVESKVDNNTQNLYYMNSQISNLDNRVNKVGAGAAALAALHPLDFDPDAKWDFAAGYGNYRGTNAAAVGAYYRPNEDTMFSVGGTFGNGENMVNAGVSFKLGAGSSHVSTSRVAMAKEIKELRSELEAMKSAMLDATAGKKVDTSKLQLFPDVPQNHWAYEYVAQLAGNGMIEGYPDGNFAGDRPMTRYEFAAILYRAMTKGAVLSDKILSEFSHELEYFTVDTVSKDKAGNPTIQRVRTVKANKNK